MSPPRYAYDMADAHEKRRQRHGTACRCICCIGRETYVAETLRLKAELDASGVAAEPPGWQQVRRRNGLRVVQ